MATLDTYVENTLIRLNKNKIQSVDYMHVLWAFIVMLKTGTEKFTETAAESNYYKKWELDEKTCARKELYFELQRARRTGKKKQACGEDGR